MYWKYRIIRYLKKKSDPFSGGYGLHEVYYNDDGSLSGTAEDAVFSAREEEGPDAIVAQLKQAIDDITDQDVLDEPEGWNLRVEYDHC